MTYLQISIVSAAIPEICNVTTVHDLAKNVAQIIPWHVIIVIDVIAQYISANFAIARVEGVRP